jgi:hypothetical protein
VIYFGKCSMGCLEEYVFCGCWVEWSVRCQLSPFDIVSFNSEVSLLIFLVWMTYPLVWVNIEGTHCNCVGHGFCPYLNALQCLFFEIGYPDVSDVWCIYQLWYPFDWMSPFSMWSDLLCLFWLILGWSLLVNCECSYSCLFLFVFCFVFA